MQSEIYELRNRRNGEDDFVIRDYVTVAVNVAENEKNKFWKKSFRNWKRTLYCENLTAGDRNEFNESIS